MENLPEIQASKIIPHIVEELYRKVGKQMGLNPDTLFRLGQCESMSDELILALKPKGIEAMIFSYHGWQHNFVVFVENGEDWIADPTWQQFLKEPDPSLPHVLITKKVDLVSTLSKLGMPQNKHDIWLKARRINL